MIAMLPLNFGFVRELREKIAPRSKFEHFVYTLESMQFCLLIEMKIKSDDSLKNLLKVEKNEQNEPLIKSYFVTIICSWLQICQLRKYT